ncbi:MAG: hypothetical protein ABSG68_13175 [Thermoguttaceae bacterium]|jgi:hypothetical protein
MKKACIVIAAGLCLAVAPTEIRAQATDMVMTHKGIVRGHIVSMTAQEIEIEEAGLSRQISVNEIKSVRFEHEPTAIESARTEIAKGEYSEAMTLLEKLGEDETKRAELAQDVEYLQALCAARMALGGNGSIVDAGKQMYAFIKSHPHNYHFLDACEIEGDLLVANGLHAQAAEFYKNLAKTPWPDYKLRAQVAMGRADLAQGKLDTAAKLFDEVIASDAAGDVAEEQRMFAKIGKARCLASTQKAAQAIDMLNEIIAKAGSENEKLHALANNALGVAYRKADKPQEALLAFLHVELLYNSFPDLYAEALTNEAELFRELHKPAYADRVKKALEALKQQGKEDK